MKPPIRLPLADLGEKLSQSIDVFVCSASYEERCLSIPLQIQPKSVRSAVVLENLDIPEVEPNRVELTEHFGNVGQRVKVNTSDPIASSNTMYHCLRSQLNGRKMPRIAVDITTFTHEQLLILLAILRQMGWEKLLCLYSGAAAYMTGKERWLSEGIAETRSVLGYPGDLSKGSGSKLVMLIGFEWERARRLIEVYDPTQLALGLGRRVDAIEQHHFQANEEFYKELIKLYPDATRFEFSCNDAIATAAIVGEQCADENLAPIVAPLNTKISTVGAALAAFRNQRIQMCYAQAAVYNCQSYSRPGEYFRAFDIKLRDSG